MGWRYAAVNLGLEIETEVGGPAGGVGGAAVGAATDRPLARCWTRPTERPTTARAEAQLVLQHGSVPASRLKGRRVAIHGLLLPHCDERPRPVGHRALAQG
jgi:hypothetical protein